MKHYHGTPIGGKRDHANQFIENRLVLIPWKRPDDLAAVQQFSQGFVVDNSAFSFWSTGEVPKWSDYIMWVMGLCNSPRFDWAIIPDKIDGSEVDNNKLIDYWQRTAKGIPCCPVWHVHETIHRLKWLVANFERVAIGSSGEFSTPAVGKWWEKMDAAFNSITDRNGFPMAKIHGLRMLRKDIIQRYPFASCDSTNAAQNGSREAMKIGTDSGWGQQTIARRIESYQPPAVWDVKNEQELLPILQEGIK